MAPYTGLYNSGGSDFENNIVGQHPSNDLPGRISKLEAPNRNTRNVPGSDDEIEVIHCIVKSPKQNTAYVDEPKWAIGPRGETMLKAHYPIHDMEEYLRQKHNMAFSVQKHYNVADQQEEVRKAARNKQKLPALRPTMELMQLESQDMIDAFKAFVNANPFLEREFPEFTTLTLTAPYLPWFHHRSKATMDGLSETHSLLMEKLTRWIDDNYGDLYRRVEDQWARGVVSFDSMPFLMRIGEAILVSQKVGHQDQQMRGVVADTYLKSITPGSATNAESRYGKQSSGESSQKEQYWTWEGEVWSYKYDGSFYKEREHIEIEMPAGDIKEETAITDLGAFPMRFADEETRTLLEKRGREFWTCRKRRLVSYNDTSGIYGNAERFMVDFNTYRQLHSTESSFQQEYSSINNPMLSRIEPMVMESDEPPPEPEIYAFPATIPAFNLRNKKWVDLEVDNFREVKWNKQSFKHLVIESESKELVHALVTNQIAREQGTDIVEGKGNGLIILLHGGPGTGKTFTAESVAELAEKPLYRVTCGDLGTKPWEVEHYLESVFHLSKIWGCVVLLDEADVFLQQRSLTDLEGNALVSIFLRVLEYHEGILILTSNRVSTFDEAFKSRIQLSLHYENLTRSQRHRIWKNFMYRLQEMSKEASQTDSENWDLKDIDFVDISWHTDELAKVQMNGRQIRNAITTARQLAMFHKEQMSYTHLKHVIGLSSKFDKWLNGGLN